MGTLKRQVGKQFVQDKESMKKPALGALRRLQKLPAMIKSFFRRQECRYAAQSTIVIHRGFSTTFDTHTLIHKIKKEPGAHPNAGSGSFQINLAENVDAEPHNGSLPPIHAAGE
jgi:hypothetical protein